MAEAANVMSIMTHNIEKGICQNANALALKMPKNVLKEVVKAENRHATQQTPAGLQAEETLRQLQGLAGDIGERLKVRHDEYNTLKKFKEQRQLGGPDSSFKWD
ncbi:unnamed protein product [Prorocentrum cordatum]|uniref:Uncharacterized protein n=1 Tax=Prorocentrum cordatum TaxID=2364126 RepID=A0ABN9RHX1_9DINO|nr:unnamed protein product [Polarella glacialis]